MPLGLPLSIRRVNASLVVVHPPRKFPDPKTPGQPEFELLHLRPLGSSDIPVSGILAAIHLTHQAGYALSANLHLTPRPDHILNHLFSTVHFASPH